MQKGGKLPVLVRGYCGTCHKEFGAANPDYFGYRIECGEGHLAQIIAAGETSSWWLRQEARLLRWQTQYSPFAVIRKIFNHISAGHFILICFIVLALALVLEDIGLTARPLTVSRFAFGTLIVWRFADLFLSNTSINFTTRFFQSPLRSVVFSVAAYLQLALCYAYFYSVLHTFEIIGIKDNVPFSTDEAVYYSFGTILTVGYGSLAPATKLGKAIVISELLAGLYFVVIIIAQVASLNSQSKAENGVFSWGELKSNE
ncbi:potassium channel family protein [Rhodoferax sp. GW822-FHT02A01]|uniref:potassium channel family protein n=1 Tax=Rhodoferax sp. GW822-FHT02A01 TaxID=3141537 RepID=UPI00315D23CE